MCLFLPAYAGKSAIKIPDHIPGATTIDAEALIALANEFESLVIIDSRIGDDRKNGYIEGSISLLGRETSCEALAKIVPSYMTPTAFYCNGVDCGRSVNGIEAALSCGYTRLWWFKGGIEEWTLKGYPLVIE